MSHSLIPTVASALLSSLSISFLVTIFMISEFLNRSGDDHTALERRPFRYGTYTMIGAVWFGAVGLLCVGLAGIGPNWMVGGAILALGIEILLITGSITWLGWKVLFQ